MTFWKQARNQGARKGSETPPAKFFAPLEKYVGHSLNYRTKFKKFGPISENSSPPWCPKLVTGLFENMILSKRVLYYQFKHVLRIFLKFCK